MPQAPAPPVRRHRLSTRLWHWLNALTLATLLMSGLAIFNAHPRLYWGAYGANPDAAWLEIASTADANGNPVAGALIVGRHSVTTTGILGLSRDPDGTPQAIAFPGWITLPTTYNLADARMWHLAFALVLLAATPLYLVWSLLNGHLRRDILPTRADLAPRALLHDIAEHARLRFPKGLAALRYNPLQKLAYAAVLLVLLPLAIVTGLSLSPGFNALVDPALLGGRQSARSLHFIAASGLTLFTLVHLAMVVVSHPLKGPWAMISGRWRVAP